MDGFSDEGSTPSTSTIYKEKALSSAEYHLGYMHGRAANACPTKGCNGSGIVWDTSQQKLVPCGWCQKLSLSVEAIMKTIKEKKDEK